MKHEMIADIIASGEFWPERGWIAGMLHSGLFAFPLLSIVVGKCCRWSVGDPIDWNGDSHGALLLDTILISHFFYAVALLMLMRGRRLTTLVLSFISLPVSFGLWIWVGLDVTGQYL